MHYGNLINKYNGCKQLKNKATQKGFVVEMSRKSKTKRQKLNQINSNQIKSNQFKSNQIKQCKQIPRASHPFPEHELSSELSSPPPASRSPSWPTLSSWLPPCLPLPPWLACPRGSQKSIKIIIKEKTKMMTMILKASGEGRAGASRERGSCKTA